MIVYGDPAFEQTTGTLLGHLRSQATSLLSRMLRSVRPQAAESVSIDALRSLLIQAGQLEQAAHDGWADAPFPESARSAITQLQKTTDHAATAFVSKAIATPSSTESHAIVESLSAMHRALPQILDMPAARLTVKIPEGFAFYTLYPEQYCQATARWLTDHPRPDDGPILVVGIRSIGTTLSAVVLATLHQNGRAAHRITVRPTGHPFSRNVEIPPEALRDATCALIIDEGPGLSGSSMAAVADTLTRLGMDPRRIAFLPGHHREPGHAASDKARAWWRETPRYVTPLSDLQWNGRSLKQVLESATLCLLPDSSRIERFDDLSAGQWRATLYPDAADRPAASIPFEQTKYRYTLSTGQSILWKFAGLATGPEGNDMADTALARLKEFARDVWTPAPLGVSHGFIATPWIDGRPLTRSDATPATLAHIGRYIAHAAAKPLSLDEQEMAFHRLQDMLHWNTHESLGKDAADRTRILASVVTHPHPTPGYGDGRLAPHEWLRTADGRLLKTDAAGHDIDHTFIGRQPLAWDLAGALVEWGLKAQATTILLDAARSAGAEVPPDPTLLFYRAAYAAFRLGQCTLCAQSTVDPADKDRLSDAAAFYKSELIQALETPVA